MNTIDLNSDVGEIDGEEPLYEIVSSINIACGAHAGDEDSMRRAVELARARGVAIGAHPGYRDREHFGRRALSLPVDEVEREIAAQILTLQRIAGGLHHVKPHGALYNQAAVDEGLARAVAEACPGGVTLVALAGSALARAGRARGLTVVEEGFADRAYMNDGTLAPRGREGAVLHDPAAAAAQALAIARGEPIAALDGGDVRVAARTICIHGDTPGALQIARAVRVALEGAGITIAAP